MTYSALFEQTVPQEQSRVSVSLKGTAVDRTGQMKSIQFMRSLSESAFEPATFVFQPFIHYVPPIHDDTAPFSWVTTTVYSSAAVSLMKTVIWVHYLLCSRLVYTVLALEYAVMSSTEKKCISVSKLWACYLRGSWFADSQSFSEVSIYSVIGLPFSLRRLDPFDQT